MRNLISYFAILERDSIPGFLADQWSSTTIHLLVINYHIDYLIDEQYRLTKMTNYEP